MMAVFCVLQHAGCILILVHFVFSHAPTWKEVQNAEIKLRANLLHNHSIDVMPVEKYMFPVVISVELIILFVKDLEPKTQSLTTEGWLKLHWHDYRLAWNSTDYAEINVIRLSPRKIWKPDIELYSSAKMGEPLTKTEVFAMLYSDGKVVWIPPVTMHTVCAVDLKYYPYDTHTCKFKFGSWTYDGYSFDIEIIDQKEIMDFTDLWNNASEWEIIRGTANKSNITFACCEERYPEVTFQITLQRRSPTYNATIVCPLFGAILFLLASLWLSPVATSRIILNVVSFLTTIFLLMHLSTKLQASGNNCPLIMTFCVVLLQISTLTITISASFAVIAFSKKDDPIPEWIRKILQSSCMKYFFIHATIKDTTSESKEDYSMNFSPEDDPKNSSSTAAAPKRNQWVIFLKLIDRIFFASFLIIIIYFAIRT